MVRRTSLTSVVKLTDLRLALVAGVLLAATGCATGSDPALITSVNVMLAPQEAVVVTTDAIKADPAHAPEITAAAVTSAPDQAPAITQAAYAAAPDQRAKIDRAVAARPAREDLSLPPAALPSGVMAQAPFTVPFRTQTRLQFMNGSLLSHSGAY
jgi:hypothetical protein